MKQGWKKRLAAVLALMLALAALPLASVLAESAARYGEVTTDQVFLRKQAKTDADYWFRVDTGHVVRILGEVTQSGKAWYNVETEDPDGSGRTYTGYMMKEFISLLSDTEAQSWLTDETLDGSAFALSGLIETLSDTDGSVTVTRRQGEITAGGTNFRMSPSTSGEKIMTLDRGTVVEILSIPDVIDSNHWYGVRYGGYDGYIMSTFVRVISESLSSEATIYGFVKLVTTSANLRSAPGGAVAVSSGWKTKNEIRPYISTPVVMEGYTWYEVVFDGVPYWVRSDCVRRVDSTGQTVTTPAPANTPNPNATKGYVITTQSGVNLRLQPFGESFAQIKKGVTLPYEHVVEPYTKDNNSQYRWYYVTYNNLRGYVRSDCVQLTTVSSATPKPNVTATPKPNVTATPVPDTTYSYVKMIKTGVNLRTSPGGKSQEQLAINTVVPVIGPVLNASNYIWYPVRAASGRTGYVRSDCVTPCNADGSVGTPAPTAEPGHTEAVTTETPTAAATEAPTPEGGIYGYVQITMDRTFIRETMDGNKLFRVEKKGGIYPMWGPQNSKNGKVWYPVVVNGVKGWVLSDCAKLVDQSGATTPPATEAPTPGESVAMSNYVITVLDKVNIRASASKDSRAVANVRLGTVIAFNTTTGSGSSLWYRVIYNNQEVWVLGSCVRVMTQAEYDQWAQQNPSNTPSTEVILGYVKTIANNVNIRDAANGKTTGKQVAKSGTVLPYSETRTVNKVIWYYITTSDGFRGWLNGNYVTGTNGDGTPSATEPPSSGGEYVPPTKGQEASYTTLKRGSSGTAVTNLVTELKLQGYYSGAITSTYTEAVEAAVKAFQKAKGLTVDGIAGVDTQHALFQTVPVGTGRNSDFTFYPAEKIDWFTGTINQEWAKGTSAKVYDVKTGIVWTLRRWSGGNHVEAEPLTSADTAKMCKAYGVSRASEIPWNYRPILVLIGEHNYCASIYGEEHTSTNDGVISNNNFKGTMCVHFTNSKTHDTDRINSGHQDNIQYAYEHAPGGQKK